MIDVIKKKINDNRICGTERDGNNDMNLNCLYNI